MGRPCYGEEVFQRSNALNSRTLNYVSLGEVGTTGSHSLQPVPVRSSPKTLTSWKEIAAHLGKGVRTVQRWEQLLGLPVRRPHPNSRVIFAVPAELDAWVQRHDLKTATCDRTIAAQTRVLHAQLTKNLITATTRLQENKQTLASTIAKLQHVLKGKAA
jgi:hypothetical protein